MKEETVWLSLEQMTKLFGRDKSVISRHINNIYKEEELERNSTVANFATVQKEGNREITRNIEYYNLDVILSVGYRVKSKKIRIFRKNSTTNRYTLAALTLLIAESNPKEKNIIIDLVMNFLNE